MPEFVRQHWVYLLAAALLHILFAGLFALSMISMARKPAPVQLAIQAVVVDQSVLGRASRAQEREQAAAAAAEQKRRQEERRLAEEQRAEQERRDQQRQAEEQQLRERQEAERKRAEEAKRQAEEAERKRVEEIKRRQEAEAQRRKAAEEARAQAAREAELRRQLEEEEGRMQALSSGAGSEYAALIEQRIVRHWNRPPSARPGLRCVVHVTQAPGGSVLSVRIGECNGDTAVKQSIEAAVMRASPLPPPPDARLFERNLELVFKPLD
jgi:colicin import membrane protein